MTNNGYIAFNKEKFGNAKLIAEAKLRSFRWGWLVSPRPHATATHEFGHAVDGWIRSIGGDQLIDVAFADGRGDIVTLAEKIRKKYKPKKGEQSDYSIHGSGRAQHFEQFAEAFAMYWHRPAVEHSRYAKILAKFIDRVRANRFSGKTAKEYRFLSDDEKRTARRELNELYKEFGLTPPYKKREL